MLNKYVHILARSEQYSKLIFDEGWQGGEEVCVSCYQVQGAEFATKDVETLIQEHKQAKEKARLEAEERALLAQREAERLEKEEQERQQRAEKERLERDKKERLLSRGGIRGVRGTRASISRTRGTAPPTTARPGMYDLRSVHLNCLTVYASQGVPRQLVQTQGREQHLLLVVEV